MTVDSLLSARPTTLYGLYEADGTFLKWGVSDNPAGRYSRTFMKDKYMLELDVGRRAEMLRLERDLVEKQPGPLNREPWAGRRSGQ